MKPNRNFLIAVIMATLLLFVWCQTTVADPTEETPIEKKIGEVVEDHFECLGLVEELKAVVEGYAPVPQTGQKSCYAVDEDGNWYELPECPDPVTTGQDGELQKGVIWTAEDRFTVNNDGTVTDNLTGLIWLQDAGCFAAMDWEAALSASNTLAHGVCDLTDDSAAGDWRLPNIRELHSLIDYGQAYDPDIPDSRALPLGHPFIDVSGFYWSSTTHASNTALAWDVSMGYGGVGISNKDDTDYHVWPVRGGN